MMIQVHLFSRRKSLLARFPGAHPTKQVCKKCPCETCIAPFPSSVFLPSQTWIYGSALYSRQESRGQAIHLCLDAMEEAREKEGRRQEGDANCGKGGASRGSETRRAKNLFISPMGDTRSGDTHILQTFSKSAK